MLSRWSLQVEVLLGLLVRVVEVVCGGRRHCRPYFHELLLLIMRLRMLWMKLELAVGV
jgi:hypothetical protein